ncbi:putative methylesterase 11, chloroplastic isoform X2 [Lycium ferocissimum]|uniref:putative methylesterase 11, chloroplastic isoform X2 n=1 Tax=Lycium ferocissimum TaxID=112874 RepID=UPI002815E9A1|nr:putative methylesterase 11, chloroplastic isoform X2 [Lycium ferocissimum]
MGLCFSRKSTVKKKSPPAKRLTYQWSSRFQSSKNEDSFTSQDRALAAAILFQQQLQNNGAGVSFDRSTSLRYSNCKAKKKNEGALPRCSSSRSRSLTDPLLQPHQLLNKELTIDDLETNHFVLVHGGGFGAWCWYKTIALLEEAGFKVTAVDLTGSGVHSSDTNSITSLSQYAKPLTDFLEKLVDGEKVILVGHDFGGACVSFAMELYPSKVSKAVFVAATMLTSGQSALDIFSEKDVALASVSMRPIPFSPVLEKLSLSDLKYGSIRRFYIETTEDNAIPIALQQSMISQNPPERVFHLKGADHSPFFSKPQALHRILVELSTVPST